MVGRPDLPANLRYCRPALSFPHVSFRFWQPCTDEQKTQEFIQRWPNSGGAERANYQLFLAELCDVLQVAGPEPTVEDDARNAYVFERNVLFDNLDGTHTTRRIDLYKRGCFVLESKQGVLQHDDAPVLSARQQELRAKRKRGHGTRGTAAWDGSAEGVSQHIRPYINGRDLTQSTRDVLVIDLYGLSLADATRRFPQLVQWVNDRVKPEREHNKRESYKEKWWIFAEPRGSYRPALAHLPRYLVTCRTAKHRIFSFVTEGTIPDAKVVSVAVDDAYPMGVLSSHIHRAWALRTGAFLEDRPDYNHSDCFAKFPFPDATESKKNRIRALGEQ